jgi:hypothetical protein
MGHPVDADECPPVKVFEHVQKSLYTTPDLA